MCVCALLQLVLKHDMARVIQCLLKFGGEKTRTAVFHELKGAYYHSWCKSRAAYIAHSSQNEGMGVIKWRFSNSLLVLEMRDGLGWEDAWFSNLLSYMYSTLCLIFLFFFQHLVGLGGRLGISIGTKHYT